MPLQRRSRLMVGMTLFAALFVASGCKSSSAAKSGDKSSTSGGSSSGGQVDVLCVGDKINNPPEPFHYMYLYADANGSVEDQADITPQTMDITIKDKSGSHNFHGMRSNEGSWDSAVVDLGHLNIPAMSSRLVTLNDTSAIVAQGSEKMNGYDTTKYAIDTGSASSSDRQKFQTLFGSGASEKGTAWMASDGCLAKLSLDEAVQINGSLKTAHYDMAREKK